MSTSIPEIKIEEENHIRFRKQFHVPQELQASLKTAADRPDLSHDLMDQKTNFHGLVFYK